MLKEIKLDNPDSIGFEAIGKVTAADYKEFLIPVFERYTTEGKKLRFLFLLGQEFTGFSKEAAWEDFKTGMKNIRIFEKCAVVTNVHWLQHLTRFFGSMIPCSVKAYNLEDLEQAKEWLNSDQLNLDYSLDEEAGVLKVNINGPLSSSNFNLLSYKVDEWIEKEGQLNGLVIQTKKFPGWDNVGSFISHINFVRHHHSKVKRVAFCADGLLPKVLPEVSKHFVKAEIEDFPYDHVEEASQWAAQNN